MKKVAKNFLATSLTVVLLSTSAIGVSAKENNGNNGEHGNNGVRGAFSQEVTPAIQKDLDEVKNDLPEVEAYEVDLNGNKTEVTPLSERDSYTSKDDVSIMSPPNDEYTYAFYYYDLESTSFDRYYELLGSVYYANKSSEELTLEYTQENRAETNWNVTTNVSAETNIGNSFLGEIKASVGVSVARDKTYYTSSTVKSTLPIKSGWWGEIKRYSKAYDGNGELVYKKYSPGGFLIGYYRESGGGWAVSEGETSYVADDGEL